METNSEVVLNINNHDDKFILTDRETEYLSLVAMGFKKCIIAQILFVSPSTVKKTLEVIFRKIHARDRANAVAIAFIHKILSGETMEKIRVKYNIDETKF